MNTAVVLLSRSVFHLWVVLMVAAASLVQASETRENQRQQFLQAEKALSKGQQERYREIHAQLDDYPLQPYLDLAELKANLKHAKTDEVRAFLDKHHGTPVGDLLLRPWLDQLAHKQAWQEYLDFYTPQSSVTRQCHRLTALIRNGNSAQAWPDVQTIWLHGKSRPSACDYPFKAWEEAGKLTTQLSWRRIDLAMQAGEWRLAKYLGKKLNDSDNVWLSRWIRLYKNPRDVLRSQDFQQIHPYREIMLSRSVRRMARFDGFAALDLWEKIADRYPFSQDQRYQVEKRIALALEREPGERSKRFITELQPAADDERLYLARLRAALLRDDWEQLLLDLPNWPEGVRKEERPRYWMARALEAKGSRSEAQKIYRELSDKRSYYGFLAADKTGSEYHLAHAATPVSVEQINAMHNTPGIQRALELHALKRDTQARREWYYVTRNADKPQLKAAAVIAESVDWHDRAIFTLAKTEYWDDLELRFPLKHRSSVEKQAEQLDIDMSWIYAVIRQESAFMRDARSHVGAMGLMQLMPATAKSVAKKQLGHAKAPSKKALLKPELNIALGSNYLKHLMQRLENSPVLATAAYNAGPGRVNQWLPEHHLDADVWVELVPFNETRRYLQRVMYYSVIYDKRLGREPKRLHERMQPIASASSQIAGT